MNSLAEKLGYTFKNVELMRKSLTHKSFHNEMSGTSQNFHNETLEFLGDAVLDLVLSVELYKAYEAKDEGELSKLRASLVNESTLAEIGAELGIQHEMFLGKGERISGGMAKPRLLASALEALIGAIYLDGGYDAAYRVLQKLFANRITVAPEERGQSDHKTLLQELIQDRHRMTPVYEVLGEEGPDHEKIYHVTVSFKDQSLAVGSGRTKKQAEQQAAQRALEKLK